jgi:hypothetical protein
LSTGEQTPLWPGADDENAGRPPAVADDGGSTGVREKLVSIVELSGNSNEDAYGYANYWAKLDICAAAGIPEREAERLSAQFDHSRQRFTYTAEDGTVYAAELRTVGNGGPPTGLPLRRRRPGDSDWPS